MIFVAIAPWQADEFQQKIDEETKEIVFESCGGEMDRRGQATHCFSSQRKD
jgi:hypothetical protein